MRTPILLTALLFAGAVQAENCSIDLKADDQMKFDQAKVDEGLKVLAPYQSSSAAGASLAARRSASARASLARLTSLRRARVYSTSSRASAAWRGVAGSAADASSAASWAS